jgi:hypothetical protein
MSVTEASPVNGATSALVAGFAVVLGCAVASDLMAAFTLPAHGDYQRMQHHPPTATEAKPTAA